MTKKTLQFNNIKVNKKNFHITDLNFLLITKKVKLLDRYVLF